MLIKLDVEKTLLNSLSLLLLLCSVSNASYTEPLDDWNPAFTYSPTSTGRWNDQTCNICTAQPIRAYLHGETWHEMTNKPSEPVRPLYFTVRFTGTAINIFAVFWERPEVENEDANYDFTYAIDNGPPRSFYRKHEYLTPYSFVYNQSVLQFTDLEDVPHVVNVTLNEYSYFMLDYALITHSGPDPAVTTTSPSLVTSASSAIPTESTRSSGDNSQDSNGNHSGVIIGSVVGGILGGMAIMALILGGLIYRRRRRRRQEHLIVPTEAQVSPFHQHLDLDNSQFQSPLVNSGNPSAAFSPYEKVRPAQEPYSDTVGGPSEKRSLRKSKGT